jgi:signal peptidase I
MEPVISSRSYAIEVVPKSADQINVGDIISYESKYADGTIIHRVIQKNYDADGVYFILKGDNNPTQDPGKIRFDQVKRVVVAIIY